MKFICFLTTLFICFDFTGFDDMWEEGIFACG